MEQKKRIIDADVLKRKMQAKHDFLVEAWGDFSNLLDKDKARADEIMNCIAEIINAPTIEAEPIRHERWISVKDRMPKEWKTVLIWLDCRLCETAKWIGIPGKWRVTWNHNMIEEGVTHWMPLPDPPKGERGMLMREFLSRGKRVDNEKWAEGSAVWFDEDQCFIMPPYHGASSLSYAQLFALSAVMVDPKTVGRCTGLTDKNGKSIFEGDIVEAVGINDVQIAPVTFRKDFFIVDGSFGIFRVGVGTYKSKQLKIVGNIFDNPELLKAEAGNERKEIKQ